MEEKVTMLEELIQGFIQRITIVETEIPDFLTSFLQQYKETLDRITSRIETANKRYDDKKIQQQMDELKAVVSRVPTVMGVKNYHHFGAWSKSLIIGVVVAFVVTAGSFGATLYLNHQNDRLNEETYNLWLVRAMYPETAEAILTGLKNDPNAFIAKAEKAMEKQQIITAAKALADQADKDQKTARDNLKKVRSAK
ncbi:hypothetical protein ACEN9X_26340 [Mucilaginibacter sp. Mucisp86]|uniref:hypothetical protein n=1 Tax=Mucilaginibacter sp. Mucisp86 TaxID=3243060 RepID=UPI0039B46A88